MSKTLWSRLIVVLVLYFFQIWKKKEHIISISSYIGPLYIETVSINGLIYFEADFFMSPNK